MSSRYFYFEVSTQRKQFSSSFGRRSAHPSLPFLIQVSVIPNFDTYMADLSVKMFVNSCFSKKAVICTYNVFN